MSPAPAATHAHTSGSNNGLRTRVRLLLSSNNIRTLSAHSMQLNERPTVAHIALIFTVSTPIAVDLPFDAHREGESPAVRDAPVAP